MSRNLLHKSRLEDFKEWLTAQKIDYRPGRGAYQVLQVAWPRRKWSVIFDRDTAPEHYTVPRPLERLVMQFIRTTRQQVPQVGIYPCELCVPLLGGGFECTQRCDKEEKAA